MDDEFYKRLLEEKERYIEIFSSFDDVEDKENRIEEFSQQFEQFTKFIKKFFFQVYNHTSLLEEMAKEFNETYELIEQLIAAHSQNKNDEFRFELMRLHIMLDSNYKLLSWGYKNLCKATEIIKPVIESYPKFLREAAPKIFEP